MRYITALWLLTSFFPVFAQVPKTQLLFLGTTHSFADSTIGTPTRQQEILAIVNQLARFKPTKIFVEVQESEQPYLDSLHRESLRATHKPTQGNITFVFLSHKPNS